MSPPGWRALSQQSYLGSDNRARSPLRENRPETSTYTPLAQEGSDTNSSWNASASEVATWLLHPDNEQAAIWVLSKVHADKQSLWTKASMASRSNKPFKTMSDISRSTDLPWRELSKANPWPVLNYNPLIPVLLFNDDVFIVHEEQGIVDIKVLRVGDSSRRTQVNFYTEDGSAKAGAAFVGTRGRVVFEPGETIQTIEITLIPNELWDTILEFKIMLSTDEVENGIVDRFMCEANIKLFNDDPFPTNEHRQHLIDGKSELVPKRTLVKAYLRTNSRNPVVWRRTIQRMLSDQLHNLNYLAGLFMNVYLLDDVLNLNAPTSELVLSSHHVTLFLLVFAKLGPFIVMHIIDYCIPGTTGASIGTLQESLVRLYLYCTESCRSSLGYTGLLIACNEDSECVAKDVYITSVCSFKHIGKLIMMVLFQLLSSLVFEKPLYYFPFLVMICFPVAIFMFLAVRLAITTRTQKDHSESHVAFCRQVDQICSNFQMITTYGKQYIAEEELSAVVLKRNAAMGIAAKVAFNNKAFAQGLSNLIIAIYMVYGGLSVIDGRISVGYFVTIIGMFGSLGDIWAQLYEDLATIQKAVPALTRISNFLNMPVDLAEIAEVQERGKLLSHGVNIDLVPIEVQGFQAYLTGNPSTCEPLYLKQGQMIAITSPRASGKTTLLKVIGGELLPPVGDDIYLALPSHLRVLYVASEPLFFKGTLAENMVFGLKEDDPDANMDRLLAICNYLGLRGPLLKKIETGVMSVNWTEDLSASQAHLLNMVRALMALPDVLCIERPTIKLDDTSVDKVLDTLQQFVSQKGLKCSFPEQCRRPRTVIYTTERMKAAEFADCCVNVDKEGVVSIVPKGQLNAKMLL